MRDEMNEIRESLCAVYCKKNYTFPPPFSDIENLTLMITFRGQL